MWTNKDKAFLTENYTTLTAVEIAEQLGRTADSVSYMACRLGLAAPKSPWSDADVDFLLANAGKLTHAEIAEHLGKSVKAVANKLSNVRAAHMIEVNVMDIEDNVKMRPSKSLVYRCMLSKLEVGQSFVFPSAERALIANQRPLFKDRAFRAQKIDDHSSRLWRVM